MQGDYHNQYKTKIENKKGKKNKETCFSAGISVKLIKNSIKMIQNYKKTSTKKMKSKKLIHLIERNAVHASCVAAQWHITKAQFHHR